MDIHLSCFEFFRVSGFRGFGFEGARIYDFGAEGAQFS